MPEIGELTTVTPPSISEILESIAVNGLMPPDKIAATGTLVIESCKSQDAKEMDRNRVYGVVVLSPNHEGVIRKPHRSPLDGTIDYESIIFNGYSRGRANPEDSAEQIMDRQIREGLYDNPFYGILPVITEREDEEDYVRSRLPVAEIENRIRSSILVCINLQDTTIRNNSSGYVCYSEEAIPVSAIMAILVPEQLMKQVRAYFPEEIEVIPVGEREVTIRIPTTNPLPKPVKLVVPDYETAIRTLLQKGKPLFLHGVRLPTEQAVAL